MGNEQTFSHQFSLDNSKPSFSLGGLIALRINTRAFVSKNKKYSTHLTNL